MPRYLTPARLCLLVLVQIYQTKQAASDCTLQLLTFIAQHAIADTDCDGESMNEQMVFSHSSLATFAAELHTLTSKIPGRTVYDILLQSLWEIQGLDAIDLLFAELHSAVAGINTDASDRKVTPASPLGQYIRRCHVEFTRLQFTDIQHLWAAFAAYRLPTYDGWIKRNAQSGTALVMDAVPRGPPPGQELPANVPYDMIAASTVDTDNLLGYAIYQLQKLGTRVPDDLRKRLDLWIQAQCEPSTQPLQHFVSFLDSWKAGQYTMAIESLHQYFDYSLAARSGPDSTKAFYQYALLHLSVLHADFECWDESVSAMNECIATARENNDTACLNFALSWLLYLRHAGTIGQAFAGSKVATVLGGSGNEQDEIRFLKMKARESKNWTLMNSTLLEEARLEMRSGGSAIRAQEHMLQARFVTVQHDLLNMSLTAALFQGTGFERIGQSQLARQTYQVANAVYKSHAPVQDLVKSACRLACGLAGSGRYKKALNALEEVRSRTKGVLKLEQRVGAMEFLVHLKCSVHRDDIAAARYYLNQLLPLQASINPELAFEVSLLQVEIDIRSEELELAMNKVNKQLKVLRHANADVAQRLQLLILKARIFAAAGQSPKGFSILLRAASSAERHVLVPIFLEAVLNLTRIILDLSEFETAKEICQAALPKVLEQSDIALSARFYVTLGEAYVGMSQGLTSNEQFRLWLLARASVETGFKEYEKVEDVCGMLDCLAIKSRLARLCEDVASADQADEMYLQLSIDTETRQRSP